MHAARVLIVDDDEAIRRTVGNSLRFYDHLPVEAANGGEALDLLEREPFDLVFLDIKMPGLDGLEVLQRIKDSGLKVPVVMISGHGDVRTAVEATRLGAFDFLEKPLDDDRLMVTVRNAVEHRRLSDDNRSLRERLEERYEIIGESSRLKEVLSAVGMVALSQARVLITGENGSGKELVARAIHRLGERCDGPFVEVNCAAIPTELIESELFGHERGSFTGAHKSRVGRFEQAHGGTLFLDEIGDMSLEAQAKVLRVLQEGRLERVGGTESILVDVRVIAATNKDLLAAAAENRFREDLYYRLNVVPIAVPALRERREDIPLLVDHFSSLFAAQLGRQPLRLSADAFDALRTYPWPGNIRELRNLVERLMIMGAGKEIQAADLHLVRPERSGVDELLATPSFQDFRDRSEELFLRRKLEEHGGNVSRTARALGMQRSHLYKKIEKYKLTDPSDHRDNQQRS